MRKWLARLPDPFTAADHAAGFNLQLSILQAEFSRTQVFDRPLSGRHLFEEVIRENLDLGRPEKVSLIFNRRITKRTPGTFHTRVITQGVIPSLHVSYKSSKIKQYFKEGRALRTETTINNTHDFGIGRNLNRLDESMADRRHQHRRGHLGTAMDLEEGGDPAAGLQPGLVQVEIQPVDPFDVQRDPLLQQLTDGLV